MPRTAKSKASLEAKALKAESKSAGMRLLFEAGYTVAEVAAVFSAPYGFAYGVADRAGFSETAAKRRPVKSEKAAPAKTTKRTAKAEPKVAVGETKGQRAYRLRKARAAEASVGKGTVAGKVVRGAVEAAPVRGRATRQSAAARVAAKVSGRPTAARRAANRKPRAVKA